MEYYAALKKSKVDLYVNIESPSRNIKLKQKQQSIVYSMTLLLIG